MDERFVLYVIEKRAPDGSLDLSDPQPERVFGMAAITGISSDRMAQIIFHRLGMEGVVLSGDNISNWPRLVNDNWVARRKTW